MGNEACKKLAKFLNTAPLLTVPHQETIVRLHILPGVVLQLWQVISHIFHIIIVGHHDIEIGQLPEKYN